MAYQSASAGSKYGQYMVGWLLHTGFGSGMKNGVEAGVQYRLAAAQVLVFHFLLLCVPAFICGASEYRRQGLDGAQFGLGWLHEHGEGMAKDLAAALRWYRSAAEQGHPLACDKVGHFYDRGLVVAADRAEAIRWFKRAFLGGLQEAGNELARLSAMSDDDTKQLAPAPAAPAARPQDPSEAAQSQALYAHRSSGSSVQSTMQLRAKSKERDHD